jgi:putative membrane protein
VRALVRVTAAAGVLLLSPIMGPAMAADLDDAAIVAIYNQVNSIDIETALLGEVMGYSEDVRALARMVANDHTGVRQAAHDLALDIGVTPDLPAARAAAAQAHYKTIADLRTKSGAGFDQAYLLHEIAFHDAAAKAVRTVLLPAAKSPELKAHFEAVLPHFEHHLAETIRVAKKLGYQ